MMEHQACSKPIRVVAGPELAAPSTLLFSSSIRTRQRVPPSPMPRCVVSFLPNGESGGKTERRLRSASLMVQTSASQDRAVSLSGRIECITLAEAFRGRFQGLPAPDRAGRRTRAVSRSPCSGPQPGPHFGDRDEGPTDFAPRRFLALSIRHSVGFAPPGYTKVGMTTRTACRRRFPGALPRAPLSGEMHLDL